MSGPTPHGDTASTLAGAAHADRAPEQVDGAQPISAGVAHLQNLLGRGGVPAPQDVADVVARFPADRAQIATVLQTQPGLGNQYTRSVFELVEAQVVHADSAVPAPAKKKTDRFQSGDFGADPTDDTQAVAGAPAVTSAHEAAVLNKLRADSRRFNPDFMLALQTRLNVTNKTGAFNTETLRALLLHSPQLASVKGLKTDGQVNQAVSIILTNSKNWLAEPEVDAKAPATDDPATDATRPKPIAETAFTDAGTGWGSQPRKSTGNTNVHDGDRADRVAQALGYTSYAEYWGGLEVAQFLGVTLNGGGNSSGRAHPALTSRLGVAESWLKQRHPDVKDDNAKLRERIGWHHGGNAAYADTAEEIGKNGFRPGRYAMGVHMHSFGLAIDIDPGHNPYVLGGSGTAGGVKHYWNKNMEMHLRRAAQLFGGEAVTAAKLDEWSKTLSTDELYSKVEKASASLKQYLELPKTVALPAGLTEKKTTKADKAAQRKSADETRQAALVPKFTAIGYTPEQAEQAAYDLLDFAEDGHDGKETAIWHSVGRQNAASLTTHSRDLVIALRDVAGFMWGGTEMSSVENGDFMHFDLRNTSYGQAVGQAHSGQLAMTDVARDKVLAEEEKQKHKQEQAGAVPAGAPK